MFFHMQTAFVGKHHMGSSNWAMTPHGRDFDSEQGFYSGSEDHFTHSVNNALDYHVNSVSAFNFSGAYSAEIHGAAMVASIEAHAAANAARIAARDAPKPFFGWFAFQNSHAPQQAPQSYINRYNGNVTTSRREGFAGMMIAMDDAVGNVTRALEAANLTDNLVIVWTSDNGAPVGPTFTSIGGCNVPFRGSKHTLWEGGVKGSAFLFGTTPALLPAAGGSSSTLMHAVDWFPTVMRLTGQPALPNETQPLDGVDQLDAILGHASSPPRTEILHNYDPLATPGNTGCCGYAGLRRVDADGDWKLLVDPGSPDDVYPPSWTPSGGDLDAEGAVGATMRVSETEWARLDRLHTAMHGGYDGDMSDAEAARVRDAVRQEAATWAEWGRQFASLSQEQRVERGMVTSSGGVVRAGPAGNRTVLLFQPMTDITESNDLASQYPSKVGELLERLQTYIDAALPDGHKGSDPASSPSKQGCPQPCWQPWVGTQP